MVTLPTNLTSQSTGHVDHHNEMASTMGLPTRAEHERGHVSDHETMATVSGVALPPGFPNLSPSQWASLHNAIHEWYNAQQGEETVGPRGTVGPSAAVVAPGGAVQINPGATTIQNAISANPDNTVFRCLNGTYNITSQCQPKAGQKFWFDNGATITNGGSLVHAFHDVGSRPNVKVMNGKFQGFSTAGSPLAVINNQASSGWEIAHNEISGGRLAISSFTNSWVHHNKVFGTTDGPLHGYQSNNAVIEDNDIGSSSGGNGNKWTGTWDLIFRHNWSHGNARTGFWPDFANYGFLAEWNLIEDCAENGMWVEANANTQTTAVTAGRRPSDYGPFLNVVRNNHIRNNDKAGIWIAGSTNTEVYDNICEFNMVAAGGAPVEIGCFVNSEHVGPQQSDLANNWIHNNIIKTTGVSGVGKAAAYLRADVGTPPPDPSPYLNNSKNNNWNFNEYSLGNVSTGTHFRWGTNNRTFAAWQSNHSQDLDSSAVNL